MPQRKSDCRLGQACPVFLLIAKSAEAEKAGATQHSAKHLSQLARRLGRSPSKMGSASLRFSDNVCGLLFCIYVIIWCELEMLTLSMEFFGSHPHSHLPQYKYQSRVSFSNL
jgi:hypothetical protein